MDPLINQIIKTLPKEHEIMGRDKLFNAAVLITLIPIQGEYHFVFEKRASHIRQGGEISFPGGGYEPEDKDFEATAVRETCEELGIRKKDIEVLGNLGTYIGRQGVIIEAFIGRLHLPLEAINPDPNEVAHIFTVPVTFFLETEPKKYAIRVEQQPYYINELGEKIELLPAAELGLPKKYHRPWSGKLVDLYFYQVNHEWIWGLTAELINDVIARLK